MYCRIRLTCSDTWRTLAIPTNAPVFDLSPRVNQDSMPGRTPLNELRLSRFEVGFGKQRQTAFGDEVDAAGRYRVLDHVQVVVEADSKIGIVPGYQGPLEPGQQEPEILAEYLEVHGLIGHRGIDTKGAGVRAPQAAEHGNHLEEGRFPERRVDELPTFAYPGRVLGCWDAARWTPAGRCCDRSRKTSRSVSLSVKP